MYLIDGPWLDFETSPEVNLSRGLRRLLLNTLRDELLSSDVYVCLYMYIYLNIIMYSTSFTNRFIMLLACIG